MIEQTTLFDGAPEEKIRRKREIKSGRCSCCGNPKAKIVAVNAHRKVKFCERCEAEYWAARSEQRETRF